MKRVFALILSLSSVLLLSGIGGCKKETGWRTRKFEEKTVKPKAHDVQIPAALWEKVEALSSGGRSSGTAEKEEKPKEGGHESGASGGGGGGSSNSAQRPPTNFESLKVYLIERNRGVLKTGDVALNFSNGGGELDLNDFVEPLRGSFYIVFEFLPTVENAQTKVFFLSQAVSRKIGKDQVGAGCDVFMDISTAVNTAVKGDGFLINTSDQRHVSALAGTYVFASNHDGKLHLSSLIIRDSGHRALQCRR